MPKSGISKEKNTIPGSGLLCVLVEVLSRHIKPEDEKVSAPRLIYFGHSAEKHLDFKYNVLFSKKVAF